MQTVCTAQSEGRRRRRFGRRMPNRYTIVMWMDVHVITCEMRERTGAGETEVLHPVRGLAAAAVLAMLRVPRAAHGLARTSVLVELLCGNMLLVLNVWAFTAKLFRLSIPARVRRAM